MKAIINLEKEIDLKDLKEYLINTGVDFNYIGELEDYLCEYFDTIGISILDFKNHNEIIDNLIYIFKEREKND